MSFRRLLDRTVTIVPRIVTGTDGRGNDVIADGVPIPNVRAARELASSLEDTGNARDQQEIVWIYFLPPASEDGTEVAITGRDQIHDGDDVFQVQGLPDEVTRRRTGKLHHIEARAYVLEG